MKLIANLFSVAFSLVMAVLSLGAGALALICALIILAIAVVYIGGFIAVVIFIIALAGALT